MGGKSRQKKNGGLVSSRSVKNSKSMLLEVHRYDFKGSLYNMREILTPPSTSTWSAPQPHRTVSVFVLTIFIMLLVGLGCLSDSVQYLLAAMRLLVW